MIIILNPARHPRSSMQLDLFSWPAASTSPPPMLNVAARRLAARCGVPFYVALVHAEAAGLGREAS